MKNKKLKSYAIVGVSLILSVVAVIVINLIRNEQSSKSSNPPNDITYTFYSYGSMAIPDQGHEYVTKIVVSPYSGNANDSYVEINRDGYYANGDNQTYLRIPIKK